MIRRLLRGLLMGRGKVENEREHEELRAGMELAAAAGYIVAGLVVGVLGMGVVALMISAALHVAGIL